MEYNSSNFLLETIVPSEELIVSRTDLKGVITYVNDTFAQISGYEANELLGQSHNVVRHPDMPKAVFQDLWNELQTKGKWSGYVKNLRKDQGYYWVYAEISGVYKDDKLIEYKSIRTPMSFEKKVEYQVKYDQLKLTSGELIRHVSYSPYKK
ncbi:chemotaxis protein [Poseidonibacter parvus]|uniref:Chemotaxis protein n=1 Tax=Poseidonibacter parvus TaxID=1850254 RepID=A0A1P8KJN5_9BACT|nr:PAS domain-containing protein [Poseidonibacter parvus]APW64771.1 chemotaxis protein [Poseidonibacter parvus]